MSFNNNNISFNSTLPLTAVSAITNRINPTGNLTTNQKIISDIADTMNTPPNTIDQDYLDIVQRASTFLKNPSQLGDAPTHNISINQTAKIALHVSSVTMFQSVLNPIRSSDNGLNNQISAQNAAMSGYNNVMDVVNRTCSFAARATAAGFLPPPNPFPVISNLNAKRGSATKIYPGIDAVSTTVPAPISISAGQADDLVNNINIYIQFLQAEQEGKLDINQAAVNASQLSSATLSLEGFGSTGQPSTDLMKYLPDVDELREQKNLQLLSAFDFTKRKPQIVFTSDYSPDGNTKGCIVGWRRIADASGYILIRRNIFDQTEKTFVISNQDAQQALVPISDYIKTWVLSFYENISENMIYAYLDNTLSPDQYYNYTIKAYQTHNDTKNNIFGVSTQPAALSQKQRTSIDSLLSRAAQVAGVAKFNTSVTTINNQTPSQVLHAQAATSQNADDVNPWPILAQVLLGSAKYDWILAAVNSRASVDRNDPRATTREYSYLGARVSSIYNQAAVGKFVVPKNINDVIKKVNDSITTFGISQTIAEVLHETGILYYFEGNEVPSNQSLTKVSTVTVNASPLLSGIIAAIDPETATLNLKSFGKNLQDILYGLAATTGYGTTADTKGLKLNSPVRQTSQGAHSGPEEIDVPSSFDAPIGQQSEIDQSVQFVDDKSPVSNTAVDLTTFIGISDLVRVIRLFSDNGPNRGGIVSPVPQSIDVAANDKRIANASIAFNESPPAQQVVVHATIAGIPVSLNAAGKITNSNSAKLVQQVFNTGASHLDR